MTELNMRESFENFKTKDFPKDIEIIITQLASKNLLREASIEVNKYIFSYQQMKINRLLKKEIEHLEQIADLSDEVNRYRKELELTKKGIQARETFLIEENEKRKTEVCRLLEENDNLRSDIITLLEKGLVI